MIAISGDRLRLLIVIVIVIIIIEHPSLPTAAVAIVRSGIALFILLPALRVLLMVVVFVRERDYRFGAIAALVLQS